jgi:hypothetical protein
LASYVDVPTTVTVFLFSNRPDVTTELTIHVDHGYAVVSPDTELRGTAVVSAHAPDHTVGPGIG